MVRAFVIGCLPEPGEHYGPSVAERHDLVPCPVLDHERGEVIILTDEELGILDWSGGPSRE